MATCAELQCDLESFENYPSDDFTFRANNGVRESLRPVG